MDNFVRFYMCDMLWSFALSACLSMVMPAQRAAFIAGVLGIVWECLQFAGILSGTGDFWDCCMYLIGAYGAMIINLSKKEV